MSGHTPTPWTSTRAKFRTDGEYDYAIAAEIGGKKFCIAETFGRVSPDITPDAEANAAFIVFAVNEHDGLLAKLAESTRLINEGSDTLDALVAALREVRAALDTLDHMNGRDSGLAVIRGGKPISDIIDKALAKATP